jgi:hypothetical protein
MQGFLNRIVLILFIFIQILIACFMAYFFESEIGRTIYLAITIIVLLSETINSYLGTERNFLFPLKVISKIRFFIYGFFLVLSLLPTIFDLFVDSIYHYTSVQHIASNITLTITIIVLLEYVINLYADGDYDGLRKKKHKVLSLNQSLFLNSGIAYALMFLNMDSVGERQYSAIANIVFLSVAIYFFVVPWFYALLYFVENKKNRENAISKFPVLPFLFTCIHLLAWSLPALFFQDTRLESTFYFALVLLLMGIWVFWGSIIRIPPKCKKQGNQRVKAVTLGLIVFSVVLPIYGTIIFRVYGIGANVFDNNMMDWMAGGVVFIVLLLVWSICVIATLAIDFSAEEK